MGPVRQPVMTSPYSLSCGCPPSTVTKFWVTNQRRKGGGSVHTERPSFKCVRGGKVPANGSCRILGVGREREEPSLCRRLRGSLQYHYNIVRSHLPGASLSISPQTTSLMPRMSPKGVFIQPTHRRQFPPPLPFPFHHYEPQNTCRVVRIQYRAVFCPTSASLGDCQHGREVGTDG